MKKWQKLAAGGAFTVALLAGATEQAAAGPLVSTWSYEINNAFETFQPVPGVIGLNPNSTLGAPTRLEWPLSGNDHSALTVEGTQTGSNLQTNGGNVDGATLTHINDNVATTYANEFLTGGRLHVRVDLTSAGGGTSESATIDTFFDFAFDESRNESPCDPNALTECDDVFVLTGDGGLSKEFTFQGETYTLLFGSEQLSTLDPETCQRLGLGASCVGFLTAENTSTNFQTFVRIIGPSTVSVPEPAVLALIGTGLVILGAVRRRRGI